MRIAVIGAGSVGASLGPALQRAGHQVVYGVRNGGKPAPGEKRSDREAAGWAEAVILAVNWSDVEAAIADCGDLKGKILIDVTNPLNFRPDGISLALGFSESGAERIATWAPGARVVKAFNAITAANMSDASAFAVRPAVFVASDDAGAKTAVLALAESLGFEPADAGPLSNARLLEPCAMLLIDQAYMRGRGVGAAFAIVERPV
jgi:predicted dinucleotide-binding enzyme